MNWGRVFPTGYPPFLFRHSLMPTPSQFGSVMVPCGSLWMSSCNRATLMLAAGIPLQLSGSIPNQGRWWQVIKELDMEGCTPIPYSLWLCYHDLVPWVVVVVIQSTIQWHLQADIYPSAKHTWSCRHPLPLHITWSHHLSTVDALADIHGRICSFLLIHPREVLLAWCWVITRPLSSHGIISLSLPLGVGLTGVGLVHLSYAQQTPSHKGMPISDMTRRSWLWCRMCDCLCWSVTLYKGMSVTIWCTTPQGFSSHLSLIFLFPWKASAFTMTRSPGFKSTVPIFRP